MRGFIGIMATEQIKLLAQQLVAELRCRPYADSIRWTDAENLHLTLQFLADINPEQLKYLLVHLPAVINNLTSFELKAEYVELFPMPGRPVAIALLFKPEARLERLAELTKLVVMEAGIAIDHRPFQAHLTLGRTKAEPYSAIHDIIIADNHIFPINQVSLLESKPQTTGSVYIPIKHISLVENRYDEHQ